MTASACAIYYRGRLSSCNYACGYCPMAMREESSDQRSSDEIALTAFARWIAQQKCRRLTVIFTPWGEATIRSYYRQRYVDLSRMSHVEKVVIQTNLSVDPRWLAQADARHSAVWASFHPSQVSTKAFLQRVRSVVEMGIRISVGAVALPEHRPQIEYLQAHLPAAAHMWLNAAKRVHGTYKASELLQWSSIDPWFAADATYHESLGRRCSAGEASLFIDGRGDVRRCHFVAERIGNIHDDDIWPKLRPRPCPNPVCGCYIGYAHLESSGIAQDFGEGRWERIPIRAKPSRHQTS